MNKPRFKYQFHVELVPDQGVFLLSEKENFVLSGKLYELLVPLLDGNHSTDEIVDAVSEHAPATQVYYALTVMERKGYIVEADEEAAPEIAAFWNALRVDSREARNALSSRGISVRTFGDVSGQRVDSALEKNGVQRSENPTLILALTDDYMREGLDELNRECYESGMDWMPAKPVGSIVWIGPLFRKGKTGCWACLALRLRSNREVDLFIHEKKQTAEAFATAKARTPALLETAAGMIALETSRILVQGSSPRLEGKLLTLDLLDMSLQQHELIRRPQCPVCGDPEFSNRAPASVSLVSRPKVFTQDGGHRSASPEETLRRFQQHISPYTGVVTSLAKLTSSDDFTHVYVAGHNFAIGHENLYFLRRGLRTKSSGKGMMDTQARASAICEAVERYSGIYRGDEIRIRASYRKMGSSAIHPNSCTLFSPLQYENRKKYNAEVTKFHFVPAPMDEDREADWSPVWSLTSGEFRYVPTAYCYYGYPNDPEHTFCWADSNGNAAGNSLEEAILQAFLELIERDSVALWWYNRVRRPGVDLSSFGFPYFEELLAHYRSIHHEMWVLDLTSDFGIPSFAAISRRTDRKSEDIALGFGAHLEARLAIIRAMTELAQVRPRVVRDEEGNEKYEFEDEDSIRWWETATLENQPYLVPDPDVRLKRMDDYPQLWTMDLREDVELCVRLAKERGLETLILDQTQPDIGLPVVKVIVPGLRHFWARFGKGRLYDVPVQLGWLPQPSREEDLNPIPIFV